MKAIFTLKLFILFFVSNVVAQGTYWDNKNLCVGKSVTGAGNFKEAGMSDVQLIDGIYHLYFSAKNTSNVDAIFYATSPDLSSWTVGGEIISGSATSTNPEFVMGGPRVVKLSSGGYRMFYRAGEMMTMGGEPNVRIYSAYSSDGKAFVKEGVVINIKKYSTSAYFKYAGHSAFFTNSAGNVAALITGQDTTITGASSDKLYYGYSTDGGLTWGTFTKVFDNAHDPVVVKDGKGNYKAYFAYLNTHFQVATSPDGINWSEAAKDIVIRFGGDEVADATTPSIASLAAITDENGYVNLFSDYRTSGGPSTDIVRYISIPQAYFYQYVGINAGGYNAIRAGISEDFENVHFQNLTTIIWESGKENLGFGDPVWSLLPNKNWAFTAWRDPEDASGSKGLLYFDSPCPVVEKDEVKNIQSYRAKSGCVSNFNLTSGKTSQVLEHNGNTYVFHATGKDVFLAQLSDATNKAMDLDSLCVLETAVSDISSLSYGQTTKVFHNDTLFISDAAYAKRSDGTWVLFMKCINSTVKFDEASFDELCARKVYRSTSTDLINWSGLELAADSCSVPEATVTADGRVWLHYQDFSKACKTEDPADAAIAPISAIYELDDYSMSSPMKMIFTDDSFEYDESEHYATNGNPVFVDDPAVINNFIECAEIYGCDETETTTSVTACGGYTWDDVLYSESGTYRDTLPSIEGCDSILVLNLTITSTMEEASITKDGTTLTAFPADKSYQWMECDKSAIMGQTNATFTSMAPGKFQVIVTDGTCKDTSACAEITPTHTAIPLSESIRLYSNPTSGPLTIDFGQNVSNMNIKVFSASQQLVLEQNVQGADKSQIEIPGSCGIYHLQLQSSGGEIINYKITKQ